MDKKVLENIKKSWCQTSIYPGLFFDEEKPERGQCEPTVCIIQDLYGGDIYKIQNDDSIYPKKTHYYNFIDNDFFDLTKHQFDKIVPYNNGIKLTEKQCIDLRTSSYCNRLARYTSLKERFLYYSSDNHKILEFISRLSIEDDLRIKEFLSLLKSDDLYNLKLDKLFQLINPNIKNKK